MKFTGAVLALAAAAPLASALPFRMGDYLAPVARAPAPQEAPSEESFSITHPTNLTTRATNLTTRATNETVVDKRAFIPKDSEEQSKRSLHNGIEGLDRRNLTLKA